MKAETSLHIVRVLIGMGLLPIFPAAGVVLLTAKPLIEAWMSAKALLTGDKAKKATSLENRLATKVETHITSRKSEYPNADEAALLLTQMIEASLPTRTELVGNTLTAEGALRAMQAKLPTLPEYQNPTAKALFDAVVLEVLTELLNDADFVETLQPMISRSLLAGQAQTTAGIAKLLEQSHEAQAAREQGLPDHQIDAIAKRLAEKLHDPDQARATFEAAVENAVNERIAAQRLSNIEPATSGDLQKAREMSDAGNFDDASAAAAQILSFRRINEQDRRAQATQGDLAILDFKITQDYIRLDCPAIVFSELQKITLETPNQPAFFAALRSIQNEYYERGRDNGVNFDLQVSVVLAGCSEALAEGPDQRGAALNDLAISLGALGQREGDTARQKEAATTYRAALRERTRDRVPLDWAATQNNLGIVLSFIGIATGDYALLDGAVAAYREALQERTRDRVPLDWAATQHNLGTSLSAIGTRTGDDALLGEAVAAFRAALQERARDRVPLVWAMTQNNLGNALSTLGKRTGDLALLGEAVANYLDALQEYTRDRVPLDWAMTQHNLGTALSTLGNHTGDLAWLGDAVAAYREALQERTRDRVPLDWAATQNNLGTAVRALGSRTGDVVLLGEAVAAYREALQERTRDRVPLDWAATQNNLAVAHLELFKLTADKDYLALAREAIDLAFGLLQTADTSAYLAAAETTLAAILAATPTPDPTP